VARELKELYGFSYSYLKVLQGGWDAWRTKSSQDPTGYPIATGDK
jgi:hypothetical protein